MFGWLERLFAPPPIGSLSSEELMGLCDRFWQPSSLDYAKFVAAYNELATRGPEIREWCRRLLTHSDYEARSSGAFLLGELGARHELGNCVEAVVAELGTVTRRPMEQDGKESEAITAAIIALGRIGSPSAIPHLRAVLLSDDDWLVGDCQWDAAEALGRIVGQPFGRSPDRVRAALEWLAAHPDGEAGA